MKRLLSVVALLSIAVGARAQTFGAPFPLANTRYRPAYGKPRLTTNGHDFFLFWSSDRKTRATKLDGQLRAGHVIFDTNSEVEVAWLGKRFLAIANGGQAWSGTGTFGTITGRILDEDARPVGEPFAISDSGTNARIAVGKHSIAVMNRDSKEKTRLMLFDAEGKHLETVSLPNRAWSQYAITASGDGFLIVNESGGSLRSIVVDQHGDIISERSIEWPAVRELDLAGDGTRSLLIWRDDYRVGTVTIDDRGELGPMLMVHSSSNRLWAIDAVWTGAAWTVTYQDVEGLNERTFIAQIDWSGRSVLGVERIDASATPSLAGIGTRVMAAWSSEGGVGPVSAVELPLASNPPRTVTYAATEQTLMATAASHDATLAIWKESRGGKTTSIRAGVRTRDGHWSENDIATTNDPLNVLAASNGSGFAVVFLYASGSNADVIRLDEGGRPEGAPLRITFRPRAITANATNYVLLDEGAGAKRVRTLNAATGALSGSITVGDNSFAVESLASDGDGFLIVGQVLQCSWSCQSVGLGARRLTSTLQKVDTVDLFAKPTTEFSRTLWNGSEYVVLWNADERTYMGRISPAPGVPLELRSTTTALIATDAAAMSDGSIAIVERAPDVAPRIVILDSEARIRKTLDGDADLLGNACIEGLADGALGYFTSSVQNIAPQHGTSHVMMTIARPSPLSPPDAPRIDAEMHDDTVEVEWSAPTGTINGYRIEYRVDNGSWNEVDNWYWPGLAHASITLPAGSKVAVRMRAFNDGGASEYSGIAYTYPTDKRRAVEH